MQMLRCCCRCRVQALGISFSSSSSTSSSLSCRTGSLCSGSIPFLALHSLTIFLSLPMKTCLLDGFIISVLGLGYPRGLPTALYFFLLNFKYNFLINFAFSHSIIFINWETFSWVYTRSRQRCSYKTLL